jgi:DNA-binding response OmpR family regulator
VLSGPGIRRRGFSLPGHGGAVAGFLPSRSRMTMHDVIPRGGAPRRVLLVEDDRDLRSSLLEILQAIGYEARAAGDGPSGLALLRSWRPDAVLLDLLLPGLDGREFLAAQLAAPDLAGIPVIVTSARHDGEDRMAGFAPAAVVHKPFELADLERALESVLDGHPA